MLEGDPKLARVGLNAVEAENAIVVEYAEGIKTIRIEHGKVNALDLKLVRALAKEFRNLGDERAIVLTGNRRLFSAGVDLQRLLAEDHSYTRTFLAELDELVQSIFEVPVPVIAALTGHAIAGGCLLAMACDYRIMGQGKIGVTESLVGLPVPPAALEALRFTTGTRAAELVMTGKTVEVAQALSLGLIDEAATPDAVLPRALEVAQQFATTPRQTFSLHKRMLRAQACERMSNAVARHEEETAQIWTSDEARSFAADYLGSLKKRG